MNVPPPKPWGKGSGMPLHARKKSHRHKRTHPQAQVGSLISERYTNVCGQGLDVAFWSCARMAQSVVWGAEEREGVSQPTHSPHLHSLTTSLPALLDTHAATQARSMRIHPTCAAQHCPSQSCLAALHSPSHFIHHSCRSRDFLPLPILSFFFHTPPSLATPRYT